VGFSLRIFRRGTEQKPRKLKHALQKSRLLFV
jgi:hypothetical protein